MEVAEIALYWLVNLLKNVLFSISIFRTFQLNQCALLAVRGAFGLRTFLNVKRSL